jgi:hypothetical protein
LNETIKDDPDTHCQQKTRGKSKMGFLLGRSKVVLRYMLERNAEELPENECIIFEDKERWTYAGALREAYLAANAFSAIPMVHSLTEPPFPWPEALSAASNSSVSDANPRRPPWINIFS